VLRDLVRLPAGERAKALEQVQKVAELVAQVEQLEQQLVEKRAELEAALRGEAPSAESTESEPAPSAPTPAPLSRGSSFEHAARRKDPTETDDPPAELDELEGQVVEALRSGRLKTGELHGRIGCDYGTLSARLTLMVRAGTIVRPERGCYELPKGKKGRAA
jgi:hypothetical protein